MNTTIAKITTHNNRWNNVPSYLRCMNSHRTIDALTKAISRATTTLMLPKCIPAAVTVNAQSLDIDAKGKLILPAVTTQDSEGWNVTHGSSASVGARGKVNDQIDVGGDVQYASDSNSYGLNAIMPATALLPDIDTKRTTLRLFGQYALQKNLSLRLDLIHDRFKTNDWTYTGWTYTDGSTAVNPNTSATFVGFSVVYRLW